MLHETRQNIKCFSMSYGPATQSVRGGGRGQHICITWELIRTTVWDSTQLDLQNQKLQLNKFPRRFVFTLKSEELHPVTPTRICIKQKLNKYFETWGPRNPGFSVLPSHHSLLSQL